MKDQANIDEVRSQAALFALGALPPEDAARFEQRVASGCPLCVAESTACRDITAVLPLSVPEVEPPSGLRARLFDRIGAAPGPSTPPSVTDSTLVRATDTPWQSAAPGIETRALHKQSTFLVRLAPGTSLPEHDHAKAEQCLVLEGSITTDGLMAYAGDFTYMPKGSHHAPLYSAEGCLLLIAYT
jgi:anti-sigma factor ChrR (cupin superfamily)